MRFLVAIAFVVAAAVSGEAVTQNLRNGKKLLEKQQARDAGRSALFAGTGRGCTDEQCFAHKDCASCCGETCMFGDCRWFQFGSGGGICVGYDQYRNRNQGKDRITGEYLHGSSGAKRCLTSVQKHLDGVRQNLIKAATRQAKQEDTRLRPRLEKLETAVYGANPHSEAVVSLSDSVRSVKDLRQKRLKDLLAEAKKEEKDDPTTSLRKRILVLLQCMESRRGKFIMRMWEDVYYGDASGDKAALFWWDARVACRDVPSAASASAITDRILGGIGANVFAPKFVRLVKPAEYVFAPKFVRLVKPAEYEIRSSERMDKNEKQTAKNLHEMLDDKVSRTSIETQIWLLEKIYSLYEERALRSRYARNYWSPNKNDACSPIDKKKK